MRPFRTFILLRSTRILTGLAQRNLPSANAGMFSTIHFVDVAVSTMKICRFAVFFVFGMLGVAVPRASAAIGDLDVSFGNAGRVDLSAPNIGMTAGPIAVQDDDRVIMASATDSTLTIARFNSSGTLDQTFNGTGVVTTTFSTLPLGFSPRCVAVLSDGKIVVGGVGSSHTGDSVALVRYREDGSLDPDFNGTGKVITPIDSAVTIEAMSVAEDGRVVAVGFVLGNNRTDFLLMRHTVTGVLDSTFNGTGTVTTDVGSIANVPHCVAIQSDGKIVAAGRAGAPVSHFALVRYNEDGSLDTTFNGTGKVITPVGKTSSAAFAVAIHPDGGIVAAGGASETTAPGHFAVVRYTASGSLDTTFSTDGKVITRAAVAQSVAKGITFRGSKLVVMGLGWATKLGEPRFSAVRYLPTGVLDTGFSDDGKMTASVSSADTAVLQKSGNFVLLLDPTTLGRVLGAFAPSTTTGAATDLTSTTATLNGVVNPRGTATEARFEYGTEPDLAGAMTTVGEDVGIGSLGVPIDAALGGLLAGTTYYFRAVGSNAEGRGEGGIQSFTAGAPAVETLAATGVTEVAANLHASVLSQGSATVGHFEYGTDPHFLTSTATSDVALGATNGPLALDAELTGLTPGTLYYFRAVATNTAGTNRGAILTVATPPTVPVNSVLLAIGATAPGAGLPGGPPGDAKLTSLGPPAIDEAGRIALIGKWSSKVGGVGTGIFTGDVCVAKVGGPVPGVSGAKFKTFSDPIIDGGNVAFLATFTGVPAASAAAVLSGADSASLGILARAGDLAPGTRASTGMAHAKFKNFKAVALRGEGVAILAQLVPGTGTPPVTAATDTGLWIKDGAAGVLTLALRKGDVFSTHTIQTVTVKTLVSFAGGNGSAGNGRGWLTSSGGGAYVNALVLHTDKSQALMSVRPGVSEERLTQTGITQFGIPGIDPATFASFGLPAFNDAGDSVFLASLTVGPGGVTKTSARGVFAHRGGGASYGPIARTTGNAQLNGATFSLFKDPVLAADGALAFPATLIGGGLKAPATSTLWWTPAGGGLTLLAQGGAGTISVPGVTGAQWATFPTLAIAAGRGPIFTATLVAGKGGVTAATANGVWAMDRTRTLKLLFRTGDSIGGKKLSKFSLLTALRGSTGVTRSFNDSGRLTWLATFSDRTTAIVTTEIP